jgi:hypothetical protein
MALAVQCDPRVDGPDPAEQARHRAADWRRNVVISI